MKRRKILISLLSIVAIFAIVLPVLAQTPADVEGFYFSKAPTKVYDTNGVRDTFPYKYFGLEIDQEDEVLVGYLYGFNASSVKGSKVRGGTSTYNATIDATYNRQNLEWGTQNVTATSNGTLGVYLKGGCLGLAWNCTGAIEGGDEGVDLVAGWNTLTVIGTGVIAVGIQIDYEYLGEMAGTVGSSRFVLFGPDISADLDAGNATIVGVSDWGDNTTRVFAPGDAFNVTGNGTITIWLPYGSTGSVTGDNVTVDGEEALNLTAGSDNEIDLVTDEEGTLTISIQNTEAFQISGKVRTSWYSGVSILSGRIEGFLVLSNDPWNAMLISSRFSGKEQAETPVPD